MNTLEKVRAKIIEAVPEIVELKFGCGVRVHRGTEHVVIGMMPSGEPITINKTGAYDPNQKPGAHHEEIAGGFEILGRPITLEDVLRALNLGSVDLLFTTSFQHRDRACIIPPPGGTAPDPGYSYWHLGKPLGEQSPETIEFIGSVLSV